MNDNIFKILLISFFSIIIFDCAPITSEMQSARTLGQGGLEISLNSGNVSMESESSDDEMELDIDGEVQSNSGASLAYGVTGQRRQAACCIGRGLSHSR